MGLPASKNRARFSRATGQARPNAVMQALKKSLASGNSFADFRARLIVCVAGTAILLCLPTLMVDLINGNIALVMVTGLGGTAMCAAVGAVLLYQRLEFAANLVILTLGAMMLGLLFARQGATIGFYVGVPSIIFLASLLASKSYAIFYWLGCTALLATAAWLGHTQWQTVIDMRDPVIAIGGIRIGLVILFFNLLTVMVFRDSIRDLLSDFQAKKDEVARIDSCLAQTVQERQAWTQVLAHIKHTELAIAWYYDAAAGQLKFTDTSQSGANREAYCTIDDGELEQMDLQCWQAKIYQIIVAAGSSTQGWAREIRCADTESGEVHWYAVTADTHFLASGATQVVGTLRDVTQAKLAAAGQA